MCSRSWAASGRFRNGSYAEYTVAPAANVVEIETSLGWTDLAAIPESYATAWMTLHDNLDAAGGAVDPGSGRDVRARAGCREHRQRDWRTRDRDHEARGARRVLRALGAESVAIDKGTIAEQVRGLVPGGVDRVLDLVGNSVLRDSLQAVRPRGRVCQAGFLGGLGPVADFLPAFDLPSGVQFSFFGSFEIGSPAYPISAIPFQQIVTKAETGVYQAKPARVFAFEEISEAHRLMESSQAGGKLVVAGA